jgi:hypothetical protein
MKNFMTRTGRQCFELRTMGLEMKMRLRFAVLLSRSKSNWRLTFQGNKDDEALNGGPTVNLQRLECDLTKRVQIGRYQPRGEGL